MKRRHGRPLLGLLSGLLMGAGLSVALVTTGTIALGSVAVGILPIAGLVLGFVLPLLTPWGGEPQPAVAEQPVMTVDGQA